MIDSSENLVDLKGVLEARRRLASDNQRELAGLTRLEQLQLLQAWNDVAKLRRGISREDRFLGVPVASPRPSEPERVEAAEKLAARWVQEWRFHDPKLREATEWIARDEDRSREEVRKQALRTAVFLALADAQEPQVTRIKRDRAMRLGSEMVLLQQKDLEHLARVGLTDELVRKLTAAPAGLHVFPPYRLLDPIRAALSGFDLEKTHPRELRTPLFYRWIRRRTFHRAEEWLLQEAGLDRVQPHEDWERVEVIRHEPPQKPASELTSSQATELELVEALGQVEPSPLASLITADGFSKLLADATPSQREILLLLCRRLYDGLSIPEAKKDVAEELDTTVNRIDVAFHRLRPLMRDPL